MKKLIIIYIYVLCNCLSFYIRGDAKKTGLSMFLSKSIDFARYSQIQVVFVFAKNFVTKIVFSQKKILCLIIVSGGVFWTI